MPVVHPMTPTITTVSPPTTFFTDFNSLSAKGVVKCSRSMARFIWLPLEVGNRVLLEDGEGNTCYGLIEAIDHMIRVRPQWEFWVPAPAVTITRGIWPTNWRGRE